MGDERQLVQTVHYVATGVRIECYLSTLATAVGDEYGWQSSFMQLEVHASMASARPPIP